MGSATLCCASDGCYLLQYHQVQVVTSMSGEPITITLKKAAPAIPWGFRLAGGIDFASPLAISMVNGGTLAEKAGLRPGDQVVSIKGNQVFNLRHNEAKEAIVKAGTSFEMVVQRGGQSWKPKAPTPPPADAAANPTIRDLATQHTQKHNSPIGLYSDDSIAEVMAGQAEVVDGAIGVDFKKYEPKEIVVNTNTPTYRLIHGIPDGEVAPKVRKDKIQPEDETPAWAKGAQLKNRPVDNNQRSVNGVSIPTAGGQMIWSPK